MANRAFEGLGWLVLSVPLLALRCQPDDLWGTRRLEPVGVVAVHSIVSGRVCGLGGKTAG